jgi:hypothetical protein
MGTIPLLGRLFLATTALTIGLLFDGGFDKVFTGASIAPSAEARVGRPLTPRSVAGVARRTTRRVVRRSTIYVAALPRGCAKVHVNGASYWHCGGQYYQSYSGRYVVVYIH